MPLQGCPSLRWPGWRRAAAAQPAARASLADPVARPAGRGDAGQPAGAARRWPARLTAAQRLGAAPLPDPLPVATDCSWSTNRCWPGCRRRRGGRCCCAPPPRERRPPRRSPPCGARAATPPPPWTRPRSTASWSATAAASGSGTRCCARPRWRLATPAQRRAAHRALADALPGDAARRPGPGTWPRPPSGPTTPSPTSWCTWPTRTASAAVSRPRRRPSNAPRCSPPTRTGRPTGWPPPPTTPSSPATSSGPGRWPPGCSRRTRRAPRPAPRCSSPWGCWSSTPARSRGRPSTWPPPPSSLEGPQRVWALTELAPARFRLNDMAGIEECADRHRTRSPTSATPSSACWPTSSAGSP